MGAWGTAISSNDTYADVYDEFFDHYDEGSSVLEISASLIEEFGETINDEDDAHDFWFALAKAQWECKELQPELLSKIEDIVESKSNLEVWRRLDASEGDIRKRAIVLDKFLVKLRSEKKSPRKRKKKRIIQPPFEKGECLVFKLANGNYGGSVILEASPEKGFGLNLVATTRLNTPNKPLPEDFLKAEVLLKTFANWGNSPEIGWGYSIGFDKERHFFESVGKIKVEKMYDSSDHSQGFFYRGAWKSCIEVANLQFEWEKENPKPKKKINIRDLIKKSRWRLW